MPTPPEIASRLIARCTAGFDNEHQHAASLKKHSKEIEALPQHLRARVLQAYDQATHKAFSVRP